VCPRIHSQELLLLADVVRTGQYRQAVAPESGEYLPGAQSAQVGNAEDIKNSSIESLQHNTPPCVPSCTTVFNSFVSLLLLKPITISFAKLPKALLKTPHV